MKEIWLECVLFFMFECVFLLMFLFSLGVNKCFFVRRSRDEGYLFGNDGVCVLVLDVVLVGGLCLCFGTNLRWYT